MNIRFLGFVMLLTALTTTSVATETFDELLLPFDQQDLTFPDRSRSLSEGRESMMFKPDGEGPFPALVIMPTCYGHLYTANTFDWARRAIAHGYAALVIDPLAPRGVDDNCIRPLPIPAARLLDDAFDAADHLRRQPFVDPARIALMGFSQGAMTGLAAAGSTRSTLDGREPFRSIVSIYPVCLFEAFPMPGMSEPVDIQYVPEKIVVPLLVEIGDQDTQGGPPMNGCETLLEERKARGDPVDYIIYHATHVWDHRELGSSGERVRGVYGQEIVYQYSVEVTEQSAKDAFAFLDKHMNGP